METFVTFDEAKAHCEAHAPYEAVCAYVDDVFVPLRNVEPLERAPRAFCIDPLEWKALELRSVGRRVVLVHSHLDGPTDLSERDRAAFTIDGESVLPNLELAVLSLTAGRFSTGARFALQSGTWIRTGTIS